MTQQQTASIPFGIIKSVAINVSLQCSRISNGEYCLSAYEEATDKTSRKSILLVLTQSEFENFIYTLTILAKEGAGI